MSAPLSRRVVARAVARRLASEPSRTQAILKTVAAYLIQTKQTQAADLLVRDIAHELQAQSGLLLAEVTSAHPLERTVREDLKKYLADATGARTVAVSETVDPSLIGGVVAVTPDGVLDTSIRSTIKRLAAAL